MRGVEAALHVLDAVRKGAFTSEELRRVGSGRVNNRETDRVAGRVSERETGSEMSAPDLTLASSLVYIVQRRRELWRIISDGFLGKNNRGRERIYNKKKIINESDKNSRGFDNLPTHVQDCLLVGTGGLLELRNFASAALVNAILNELRNLSQAHGERRERWVPLVNAVLHAVSEQGPERLESLRKSPALESRALWAGVPVWSLPAWSRTWSRAELNKIFELLPQSPLSCLRVAPSLRDREKIFDLLGQDGINIIDLDGKTGASEIIRLDSTVLPTNVPGFQDGLVTVQTEGSILVTSLVKSVLARKPDAFVLDMCSGRGVKAGQILQDCPSVRLECWELSAPRHRAAQREIERLAKSAPGITSRVTLRKGDARNLVPGALARENQNASETSESESKRPDLILLDAPCSGSGTWTRKPDSKWKMDWAQLDRITATQKSLLERAVSLVSDNGGVVLYVTCSLLKQENENIVADVLSRHTDCTEMPVNFSSAGVSASALHKGKPWGTYIWPETPWLDGFYCALILKR